MNAHGYRLSAEENQRADNGIEKRGARFNNRFRFAARLNEKKADIYQHQNDNDGADVHDELKYAREKRR